MARLRGTHAFAMYVNSADEDAFPRRTVWSPLEFAVCYLPDVWAQRGLRVYLLLQLTACWVLHVLTSCCWSLEAFPVTVEASH